MITGLSRLGKDTALRVVRTCLFALAFAALSQVSFAFSGNGRAYAGSRPGFYSAPRRQTSFRNFNAVRARPVFYAFERPPRQASPGRPQAPPNRPPRNPAGRPQSRGNQGPPHLGAWLQGHANMSPEEQSKALQKEPGFDQLPAQTQHQLVNRLEQIDRMPPAQRQRTLDRIEALEHLSPQMRDRVRASAAAVQALPPGRQRMVRKALRDLRQDPLDQRQSIMASPQFQGQFTPQERGILSNLLSVEPYEPNAGFRQEYSPPPAR